VICQHVFFNRNEGRAARVCTRECRLLRATQFPSALVAAEDIRSSTVTVTRRPARHASFASVHARAAYGVALNANGTALDTAETARLRAPGTCRLPRMLIPATERRSKGYSTDLVVSSEQLRYHAASRRERSWSENCTPC
jgi:hypothetical protein